MSSRTPDWPVGVDRRALDEVDSTNAEAGRIASSLSGPTWIIARHQTAGRGRRGRAWSDPVGNFSATLVMRPDGGPERAALRSFVAALALWDTLAELTGRPDSFSLKWPNDVLMNGQKVAGILLETSGPGGQTGPLCIGIGINLMTAPEADGLETTALPPASVLSGTGATLDPGEVLDYLAPAFAKWELQLATFGFAPIRTAFLDRAARLGEVITARTARESLIGTFETIDETGAIVLTTSAGRVAVPAADIFF